jgi:hypothetical protein
MSLNEQFTRSTTKLLISYRTLLLNMPDPTIVYHGCHVNDVQNIYDGIAITKVVEGDFNRSQNGRAFYTTADQSYAEHWAITEKDTGTGAVAVVQLRVNFDGLVVKRFQTAKTEAKYLGDWQTVRKSMGGSRHKNVADTSG